MGIILWLIFGALVGWIASKIMHTDAEQGALTNIIVGIAGALIGGFVSNLLGGPSAMGFNITSLIIAILGAVLLLAVVRMFTRGGHSTV